LIFNQYNTQSTDTGDYFPEGYNAEEEIAFSSGMMGSQAGQGGNREGPELPGKFHPLSSFFLLAHPILEFLSLLTSFIFSISLNSKDWKV
jgi:hypothetical protein